MTSFLALGTYYKPVTALGTAEAAVITRGQAPAPAVLTSWPVCAGGAGGIRGDTCCEK